MKFLTVYVITNIHNIIYDIPGAYYKFSVKMLFYDNEKRATQFYNIPIKKWKNTH